MMITLCAAAFADTLVMLRRRIGALVQQACNCIGYDKARLQAMPGAIDTE